MDSTPTTLSPFAPLPRKSAGWSTARLVFEQALRRLHGGSIELRYPDGLRRRFGDPEGEHSASLHVHSPSFFKRVVHTGGIGLGESYMHGEWDSPNLSTLLGVLGRNQHRFDTLRSGLHVLACARDRLLHRRRDNHLENSKQNIAEHYDLSNAFYEAFLDDTMTYSSALFLHEDETLEDAQRNKIARMLELSGVREGDTLLEIGTGWGALAIQAVREHNCNVVSLTLSEEQLALAQQRCQEAGVADRVDIRLLDYRKLDLQADALVSVEMIEAVGHRYLPEYFQTIARCLKPGGRAALQAITIPDARYERYRKSTDFIRKHIFPGGHLPSPGILQRIIADTPGLRLCSQTGFGQDYATTLDLWDQRFQSQESRIAELGFNEAFRRKWRFYFAYCEAGFREQLIDVVHLALQKD